MGQLLMTGAMPAMWLDLLSMYPYPPPGDGGLGYCQVHPQLLGHEQISRDFAVICQSKFCPFLPTMNEETE